jgi:membrane protein DedA with SNARE-associated domain
MGPPPPAIILVTARRRSQASGVAFVPDASGLARDEDTLITPAELLQHYGYAAVLVGTLVEGESMLLLGGYAAHRGYLELPKVIAAAFVAAVASDQLYFHLSRRHGARMLAQRPRLRAKVDKALTLVERHDTITVFAMRFLWGLRIALPVAIGMSTMSARRYFVLNLVAAALWSGVIGVVGFGATGALARVIDDLRRHEATIIAVLGLLAIAVIVRRWWQSSRVSAART